MEHFDIIVIGAGPAGLMAAGRAAERGKKVLILEKMQQEGRKLRITGKGRCNITNDKPLNEFIQHIYPNGRFLKNAFHRFFSNEILQLLEKYGVVCKLERGGRYFPESDRAEDVLNALIKWNQKGNVQIYRKHPVQKLNIQENTIQGVITEHNRFFAPRVILATGGISYPATGSTGDGYLLAKQAGHTIEEPLPALVPLETQMSIPKNLQGLTLKNVIAAVWVNGKKDAEAFGELEFMPFGLSGPIILTLSRRVVIELHRGNSIDLYIDLKPALDDKKLNQRLIREFDEHGKKKVSTVFRQLLPAALIPFFLDLVEVNPEKPCHQISSKERKKIRYTLKNMAFKISGHRPIKEAIITAGGVPTREISSKTMESKKTKGLYFAGEIINLDAETGGYNLQLAYSTGWVAGDSSASEG
ncbi:MAG: NAD(P)/FAD-dependent oxidoreductase [Bacteroidales bacterium]|jgi:predicted Rossmann fold flavoprotein|nr:NAD(P)/FAD-dependent oxidoreductase [Bacteroidales bacterium]